MRMDIRDMRCPGEVKDGEVQRRKEKWIWRKYWIVFNYLCNNFDGIFDAITLEYTIVPIPCALGEIQAVAAVLLR